MESILTSVKKSLGITEEYEHFDADIIMHINSVLATLNQIGVGPSKGFSISDSTAKWTDFVPAGSPQYEPVKSYVCLKVRLIFDPPQSSAHIESIKSLISEFEWRLSITTDIETNSEEVIQNGD